MLSHILHGTRELPLTESWSADPDQVNIGMYRIAFLFYNERAEQNIG